MERALLEGEHQTEMGQLQSDQEKINHLREKQTMLIEKATREREKVGEWFMSHDPFALRMAKTLKFWPFLVH